MWQLAWRAVEEDWNFWIGNDDGGLVRIKLEEEFRFAKADVLSMSLLKLIEEAIEGRQRWRPYKTYAYP
jgi:hypothetical protein